MAPASLAYASRVAFQRQVAASEHEHEYPFADHGPLVSMEGPPSLRTTTAVRWCKITIDDGFATASAAFSRGLI
jgi:hypothetical protein